MRSNFGRVSREFAIGSSINTIVDFCDRRVRRPRKFLTLHTENLKATHLLLGEFQGNLRSAVASIQL
ncbi:MULTISPECIES: hypothetical protein [unclassified Microcoleus]|uniref:hypothetical protein n=1 Tax=unclassified Microcoleus TaxID=2642155 RepID=UPI001D3145FD|nr:MULTISPECIES: hypothetical protein [unclassified Microcoleus]MCC3445685.1 hypothetical protein [Microcoleus sp. PH2017_03_ELD_O_A]MCC3502708.1 hypothetical protein [Microcoleus sp. PH2017_19_SFW_U_A]MCC3413075.1 hypothetical protein [Microcoleus sp. PH2017_02_FOX_O_A]MCC3520949.1 hypothetical protein [Microcoleus sp. PH2017_20_SFW_D_A]MCC3551792.1 hypothetical protein [Microcoleus sp. PH2017_35_SFW_U_B]